jgi:AP-2 complex subunit alpha
MKGIQAALGIEAPSHMKGLQVFISDIRNCPSKEQEEKRVETELAKIRLKFTSQKAISGYDKKKYVWKLLYAYMLGYEIDFGHFQAVELCSSTKFSEKTAGYLAISLLLADNGEILRLVVNSIKNDMNSGHEHIAALALNTVANIGGTEFADNLFADISKMLLSVSAQYSPYLKRKACICLLRLYRRDNDTMQPEVWRKKLSALFHDKDVGLLTSASGFMLAILEQGSFPVGEWAEIIPAVGQCLNTMVSGECPEHYEYYHVPAPWLQTKLLRILQFFEVRMFDGETLMRINQILLSILTKPAAQRAPASQGGNTKKRCKADAERLNRSNAEHSILFEAMNLMIHLEDRADQETTRTAASLLGAFISSTDPNIRYLGLETMARLARNINTHEHLERYKNLILEKMHETDISIRRQALNLLYALCRPENWQQIVDELLEILGHSDALLQEELVLKIAILAEKNAPNFTWYVDVVFKMLENAPESVGDDVWYRVVQVVTGFEDGVGEKEKKKLQQHAADKAYSYLNRDFPHETMVKLGAYMIGEFGHYLKVPPRAKLDALMRHFQRGTSQVKAIITLAAVKLLNANEDLRDVVHQMLEDMQDVQDAELQQRSCELLQLCADDDVLEDVLCPMPQYAESVQKNNPLVQRLKFQIKSRAHTRAQLEDAAKSEGGVYNKGGNVLASGGGSPTDNAEMLQLPGNVDRGGSRGSTNKANVSGSETESESDSDEDRHGAPAGRGGPEASGQASKDLWQQLCIMGQGRLYNSPALSLDLKHEYNMAVGRLTFLYTNNSREPITNIRCTLPEVPFMRFQQASSAPQNLAPGATAQHHVQVQCTQPFLQAPRYLVEYRGQRGPQQVACMLPSILTKFISPAEVQMAQFRSTFEAMNGPQQEAQLMGQAKQPPGEWPNYLQRGFNMFLIPESNPQHTFAAGTFHAVAGGDQEKAMTVPVLLRLEFEPNRRLNRVTVRSQYGEVSQAVCKIIESYLMVPPQKNGDQ